MEKYVMKLRRVSTHSYAVTLPKEVIKKFRWRERQKVVVSRKGKTLTIRDWKK